MSDDINIRLKTTLEADEAKSAQQIESQLPSITSKIKSKVKVVVEADPNEAAKTIQRSLDSASTSQKNKKMLVPISAAFNINLRDSNAVEAEVKRLIAQFTGNKGAMIDFKIKTDGVNEANRILLRYKNDAEETISTVLKLVDVTQDIERPEFAWEISSNEFSKNIQKYEKGLSAIKEAERKASGEYWQKSFVESAKSLTATDDNILKMRDYYKELETISEKAEKLRSVALANKKLDLNFAGYDEALHANDLQRATAAYESLNQQYEQFKINSKKDFANNAIEKLPSQILEADKALTNLIARFEILQTKGADAPSGTMEQLHSLYAELQSISSGTMDVSAVTRFKEISFEIEKITGLAGKMESALRVEGAVIAADTLRERYVKLLQTLDNLKIDWSAFAKNPQLVAQFDALRSSLVSAMDAGDLSTKGLSNFNAQFGVLKANINGAGLAMKTFWGRIGDNIKKFSSWFFIGGGVASAVRGFKEVINAVKEVNLQMTALRKVTDETEASYKRFLDSAKKRSVDLGASLSDYIGSVTDYSRMGYSLADSQTLSDVTTIYYKVGDGMSSMEDATQSVISTLKAYKLSASEAASVTDIFNEISNNFAVTSAGIGSGMQRAGAALATANTSLEKSVALWTAMNEVIQNDESSATALRFIAQRMRNTAGDLEKSGEDADGAAESITKLQQQILEKTDVNIMSDADTFRDVYDVLKDISDVWDDITDKDRADVIRLMAGSIYALAA